MKLASDPLKSIPERLEEIDKALRWSWPRRQIMRQLWSLMETVDSRRYEELQRRYADGIRANDRYSGYKYLDVPFYVWVKLMLARRLGLNASPALRVLDIGTGGGHFLFVCRFFGHVAIGIDIEDPRYEDVAGCLGVERTIVRVQPQTALPDLGGRFDLITAYGVTFNDKEDDADGRRRYWSLEDWRYFLNDLVTNQLRYPGTILLQLNEEFSGGALGRDRLTYNDELLKMAARMGATVSRRQGAFKMSFGSHANAFAALKCVS